MRIAGTSRWAVSWCAGLVLVPMLCAIAQPADPAPPPPAPAAQPEGADAAPEVELRLKYAQPIEGRLVGRTDKTITISVAGINTTFPIEQVENIIFLPPVEVRYEELRRRIADDDVPGLLNLARWLIARNRYDLAQAELARAAAADPDQPEVRDLVRVVDAHLKLVPAESARTGRPFVGGEARPARAEFPLLSPEQINLIRVYEIDLADPPRMVIQRDTLVRFLDKYAGQKSVPVNREGREAFLLLPTTRKLEAMFEVQAREFYPEVKVQENPRAFRLFKQHVQGTWLTNNCATSQCHGGEQAGRLWLTNRNSASDAAAYTNFLILDRFRLSDGLPLIDYTQPARSPVLQFALPRDQALMKHPEIQGLGRGRWRPAFSGDGDERFLAALDWINSMYRPRPTYPIDYQPPVPDTLGARGPDGAPPPPR